jgi:hypothetical protein
VANKNLRIALVSALTVSAVLFAGKALAVDITATVSLGVFVPGQPSNLAATIGDKSVELSWSPPSNGGSAITDYIVEYRLSLGGSWSSFDVGSGGDTSATLTGLSNDNSYDFRVSAVNAIGQGPPSPVVSATPGPPAQVIVQSFLDLYVPSIGTNVRITNEGLTAYEYNYTWCVTDSDTNLCGGGDDVFDSTAAKWIDPGQNYDTTLNSTVPSPGNYWFHVAVQYGSDSSQASQSFTAVTETTPPPPPPPPGGGGGGGSGGAPACVGADFNHDGRVDSVDFSIMLAYWGTSGPINNPCVDINGDKKIDSVDFSILLYQWGRSPIPFK